jgi:predicted phage tail protein
MEAGSSAGAANLAALDLGSAATTMTVPNVAPGTYFVRVRARTAAGTSAPSNEIVLTVGAGGTCTGAPAPPSGLVSSVNGGAVTLSWQAPSGNCPATAYVLEAGSAPGLSDLAAFSIGSAVTTFATASVPRGIYYIRVRAANGAGTSGPSNEVTVTVP